jgi:hypothetical protein
VYVPTFHCVADAAVDRVPDSQQAGEACVEHRRSYTEMKQCIRMYMHAIFRDSIRAS